MSEKTEVTPIDIPKHHMELMDKGICPICKMPMRKPNGKETHSRTKKMICEELLRERLKDEGHEVKRSSQKIGDKEVEVDARLMSKPDADQLKEKTERYNRFGFRKN